MIHHPCFVKRLIAVSLTTLALMSSSFTVANDDTKRPEATCEPLLEHAFRPLMGPERSPLCESFSGQVLLVVNTASRCGFTPQFEDLETLYQRYQDQGFQVLGFPSADFRQEYGDESRIAEFCEVNYGVSFPMFEKISVSGNKAHPFYQALKASTGTYPRWNFNKYLIDREGHVVAHYQSGAQPLGERLVSDIEALLQTR